MCRAAGVYGRLIDPCAVGSDRRFDLDVCSDLDGYVASRCRDRCRGLRQKYGLAPAQLLYLDGMCGQIRYRYGHRCAADILLVVVLGRDDETVGLFLGMEPAVAYGVIPCDVALDHDGAVGGILLGEIYC